MKAILLTTAILAAAATTLIVFTKHNRGLVAFAASDTPKLSGTADDWLNTHGKPVAIQKGKVYLIDFWEYTCVNCIRTLPYVKAWNDRYAKYGLVIVGIHTPEFAFAKERANVATAVKKFGLTYPILIDSNYVNWNYWQGNSGYWPRKYLVDATGKVVYEHAGEGGYGETEKRIQEALKQANPSFQAPATLAPVRPEDKPGSVCYPTTPEIYAGQRGFGNDQLGNVDKFIPGKTALYTFANANDDGKIYLQGAWITENESLRHARETTGLLDFAAIRYHALGCNAVIKPEGGKPFRLYVVQDGAPIAKTDAGDDIRYDEQGRSYAQINTPGMVSLTKNAKFGSHVIKLAADSPDFGLYSFTFISCVAHN